MTRPKSILPDWLTLGNVLTIITMAVGGLWVLATMNTAQAVQNSQIATLKENQQHFETQVMNEIHDMRADIKELLQRSGGKNGR